MQSTSPSPIPSFSHPIHSSIVGHDIIFSLWAFRILAAIKIYYIATKFPLSPPPISNSPRRKLSSFHCKSIFKIFWIKPWICFQCFFALFPFWLRIQSRKNTPNAASGLFKVWWGCCIIFLCAVNMGNCLGCDPTKVQSLIMGALSMKHMLYFPPHLSTLYKRMGLTNAYFNWGRPNAMQWKAFLSAQLVNTLKICVEEREKLRGGESE